MSVAPVGGAPVSGAPVVEGPIASRRRREDVIAAAGRLFAASGYHGTSMRDLGEELGLLGSSLYSHIGSKNELLEEIVSNGVELCLALAAQVRAEGGSPRYQLRRLVVSHVELVAANLDTWLTFVNEYRFLPDEQLRRVVELRDAYQGSFHSILTEGSADGTFHADLDAHLLANLLLSVLNAVPRWYRVDGLRSATEIGESIYDLVARGICSGGVADEGL